MAVERVLEIIYHRINQLEEEITSFIILSDEINGEELNNRIEVLEDLITFLVDMNKNESLDIRVLKLRIVLLIRLEEYEIANRLKEWIIELGGDPDVLEYLNMIDF
jgi:uncharacterized protein YigA (DUF484 family)